MSLDIVQRLSYFEDDEKAMLMGNILTLYLIYALTGVCCLASLFISWKLYSQPRKAIEFAKSVR